MTPQEAIKTMIGKGMTHKSIAELCGVQRMTIVLLDKGTNKEPKYTLGCNLVRLGKLAQRRKGKKNEKN